jgi:hypothetical protein
LHPEKLLDNNINRETAGPVRAPESGSAVSNLFGRRSRRGEDGMAGTGYFFIETMRYLISPAGALTEATSPTLSPIRARPTGLW